MSKNKKPAGIAWGEASDELKAKVKLVLQMAQNNRYSVSRIYAAHNAVFGLKETPETCSTCLTSREKSLRKWWAENAVEEAQDAHQPINTDSVNHDENAKPADAVKVKTTGEKHTPPADSADAQDQADGAALEAFYAAHEAKLAELGVTADSSDEDLLEALEVLAGTEGNTEEDQQHYDAQVAIVKQRLVDKSDDTHDRNEALSAVPHVIEEGALKLMYTRSTEDASKGTVAWEDGSKVKAGTYTSLAGVNIAVQVGGKATIK